MDVTQLVRKAKTGDKEALLTLIMEQEQDYYKLAFTYMGNRQDALDALEDMIVTLYEKIHQLKKAETFYSWSKTILANRCKSMLKKKRKVVLVDEWHHEAAEHHLNLSLEKNSQQIIEDRLAIQNMLRHLNLHQEEAIRLRYFHDLDYQSIADLTKVSLGTVKSRISQGLKKLNKLYGGGNHAGD
nr:sigma-70 family RNA polymerase sigma factor [Tuberibacillus sp. Marseille-P3662]